MSDQMKHSTPKKRGPMGMGQGMAPIEKAKDFKGSMRKLAGYLGRYKLPIVGVLILAVASTIFSILGPNLLGDATDLIVQGIARVRTEGRIAIDFEAVRKVMRTLILLYLASAILGYSQSFIMTGIAQKVTYRLRRDISQKMNRMPLQYFDAHTHGEVLSRMTNDVDLVSQTLGQSLTQIVTSLSMVVGVLVMMLRISPLLTVVALVVIPISLGFILLIIKRSQIYFKQQQAYLGHINGHIEEMYGGYMVVQAFNKQEQAIATFNQLNETLYTSAWKAQFLSSLMMPIMNFVGNIGYVLICLLGGYMAVNGRLNIGDIQAFIQYMRNFTQPLSQIASISNTLQSTAAASERVFSFLEEQEEVEETRHPVKLEAPQGQVTFEQVRFGYRQDKPIIRHFNAVVAAGQKVAIVGPTGAGKTTIVKLLMRFYELESGQIKIDGIPITAMTRQDLRALFGMVLQDTWLYHATLLENIRYGNETASEESVKAAAKAAHIDHFIKGLPKGYETVLSEEGGNVSAGQKQLITIARAILKDPKILILDEATSSVDTRTEVLIQKAMQNLMKGRTSFIIAHRLSTIRDADLILVMKAGDIVEQGTHETLLEKGGFYAQLYNSQFEEA